MPYGTQNQRPRSFPAQLFNPTTKAGFVHTVATQPSAGSWLHDSDAVQHVLARRATTQSSRGSEGGGNRTSRHAVVAAEAPEVVTIPVSIVVPCRNEAESILPLIEGSVQNMAAIGRFEIIVVDDGSDDGMADLLKEEHTKQPDLRILRHDLPGGQSAAIHSGVAAATHSLICTLGGDAQNPPEEPSRLIAAFPLPDADTLGLVAGQRVERKNALTHRLALRLVNAPRSSGLRNGTGDNGCGLKWFRCVACLAQTCFGRRYAHYCKDPVFVLGQSLAAAPNPRNLWLIHANR